MIPLRMRLFWSVLSRLQRAPLSSLAPEDVAAARRRLQQLTKTPGAWLVVGRPNRTVTVLDQQITLADGTELPVRSYRPPAQQHRPPLVLNFHGGGFVSGDPRQSEWWCGEIAAKVGAVVVSVDYRLAPEHPFPGPPEDCYAATLWAVEHADELGIDPDRVAVMGDSAGGNLAAVVAMLARDRSGPRIALQILLYPAVEMVATFPSAAENEHAPILGSADVDGFGRLYLAGGDGADPRWSPLRGKHDSLPRALIQTAQHDPLRDQGTAYAEALRSAGVPVRLTNYVDAVHGYISVPGLIPVARQALAEAVDELEHAFSVATNP